MYDELPAPKPKRRNKHFQFISELSETVTCTDYKDKI